MLWSLLTVSIRNVTRNARRSMITALAVLIGTGFTIFARGTLNGFHSGMVAGVTESSAGDIQLHRPEYLEANEALPLDKSFSINDDFGAMMAKVPEIEKYSGRIMFSGMISNGEDTTLFFGQAIDPENEYFVCPKNKENIQEGGSPVDVNNPKGIVLGRALADSLKVGVGAELTLLVNTRSGALNGVDVTVSGIAEFRLPGIGNKIVQLPLPTAQRLLQMDGQVTEVVANVKRLDDVDPVKDRLEQLLHSEHTSQRLRANTWKEVDLGRFILNAIELQNEVLLYVIAVLFIVMISGIWNTMMMSVFERVREIGTMMALGIRRNKILWMFILESLALGAIGAVLGIGLGWGVVSLLGRFGLPLPSIGGGASAYIYPYIQLEYMLQVLIIALVTATGAALFPAFRASRQRPAEALRTL